MLIVLPVCHKDAHLAALNLRLVKHLDPRGVPFRLLIVHERGFGVADLVREAKPLFKSVSTFAYDPCPFGLEFPKPHNHAWQSTARHVAGITPAVPWLWWEPDAVPTCRGWATKLWEAYRAGGRRFAGSVVNRGASGRSYVAGVAIYPPDVAVRAENAMITREAPFDIVASVMDGAIVQAADIGKVLVHDYRADGGGREWGPADSVPEGVALWHRCERGDLQRKLLGEEPSARAVTFAPSRTVTDLPVVVQLGRLGDVLNILPVLRAISQCNSQRPVPLIIHESMLPAVARTRYAKPVVWRGIVEDVAGATKLAATLGQPRVAQLFSRDGLTVEDGVPYNIQHYERLGWGKCFGQLPLEFDARDFVSERKFRESYAPSGPYVVLNVAGLSSPYRDGATLVNALKRRQVPIVDVSGLRVSAMADLLGLLDDAAAVVTIDTSTLHLANASHAPLVALTSDSATWKRTAAIRHRDVEVPYQQVEPESLAEEVAGLVSQWRPVGTEPVYHIMPRRECARSIEAVCSFDRLYATGEMIPRHVWHTPRWADRLMGDKRKLPFLRDVLVQGMAGIPREAIVVFTNDDVWLHSEALWHIRSRLRYVPLVTCHRADVPADAAIGEAGQVAWHHAGRDLFAARAGWLREHLCELPDFILGASDWDIVLAAWARQLAGTRLTYDNVWLQDPRCELPFGLLTHRVHEETWNSAENVNTAPSQLHNRLLAGAWYRENSNFMPHWRIVR